MMRFRRWCWSCAAFVWGMYLVASVAYGSTGGSPAGPGWRDLALGAIGLVSMLLGVTATRFDKQLDEIKKDRKIDAERISGIREAIAREHYTKAEIKEGFHRVDDSVAALHRRLDLWGVPHAPRPMPDSSRS